MRLKLLKIFYIFILVAIAARLFYWQVLKFDDLSAMAEQQRTVSLHLDAPRGTIYALDGAILASNKPTFLLYGLPKVIKDKKNTAKQLAKILAAGQKEDVLKEDILKKEADLVSELNKKLEQDLNWVILDKSIELSDKNEIEKAGLEGVGFESQSSRFYPEASSAAHILGFVGSDSLGKQKGYFGIEGFYDGELQGIGGVVTEERDARGLPILSGTFFTKEPKNGHNLVLNIDRAVQYIVEKKLKAGMEKYGAKSGSVVIMDPKTGAIVAMASFPSYDPSNFGSFSKDYYKNSVVADAYEPGSTFKVLVMAAGINEDLVKPDTKCDICSKPVEIAGFSIRTWNNKYTQDTTMSDVIIHSDNTGMVFVSRKLGIDKMYRYIKDFGFGDLTKIDLQDEASPDIRPQNEWREIDLATASFGQGIAATPIQMVRAVSTIANGGNLMEPQIVKKIESSDKVIEIHPKIIRKPISPETAKTVTQMMVDAVSKGEAQVFAPKGYKIAGKTGTAQIPVAGHYDANKTIASFVGFAPADDPKFVMLVRYEEPSSSIYGAETAAPTFFDIAKELFTYYNIGPS